jgi:hypothetical protein
MEQLALRLVHVGDVVKTNYGTGPYRVEEVSELCTCPSYLSELNGDGAPSRPHVHLVLTKVDDTKKRKARYWLNGYDPATLQSVWSNDRIEHVEGGDG